MAFDLSGYIDVATRIAEFREKHPSGSLAPLDPHKPFEIVTIGECSFVVVVAAAYRTPDDPNPGVGMAWEPFPGKTPYTKDSELQNAETSAWGRALIAALVADTRSGVASADEVRNRQDASAHGPTRSAGGSNLCSDKQRKYVAQLLDQRVLPEDFEYPDLNTLTKAQASPLIDRLLSFPEQPKAARGATKAEAMANLEAQS